MLRKHKGIQLLHRMVSGVGRQKWWILFVRGWSGMWCECEVSILQLFDLFDLLGRDNVHWNMPTFHMMLTWTLRKCVTPSRPHWTSHLPSSRTSTWVWDATETVEESPPLVYPFHIFFMGIPRRPSPVAAKAGLPAAGWHFVNQHGFVYQVPDCHDPGETVSNES